MSRLSKSVLLPTTVFFGAGAAVLVLHIAPASIAEDSVSILPAQQGTAAQQSAGEDKSKGQPPAREWGDPTPGERRYPSIGARMLPPPRDYKPTITAEMAIERIKATGVRPDVLSSGDLTAELVVYSNDDYGDVQDDGSVTPRHRSIKAWAIRTAEAPVEVHGPIHRKPDTDQLPSCPFVYVVDATSGEALAAFQSCEEERY
jgi:hypothetical protein